MEFPAIYVKHDNKVLWLLHQHRQAYDLWGTEFGDLENFPNGKEVRDLIRKYDKICISESKRICGIPFLQVLWICSKMSSL